jgi:hypothetical protein
LDVSNCPELTQGIIEPLATKATSLDTLNLSNLPKLRWVSGATAFNYEIATFPALEYLNISNCSNLEALCIKAPKLKKIWATDYPKAKQLIIQDAPLCVRSL